MKYLEVITSREALYALIFVIITSLIIIWYDFKYGYGKKTKD